MSKKPYTLKVRFYSPIAFYDPPMLDGIIARALCIKDRTLRCSYYRAGDMGPKHLYENGLVKLLGTINGLHLVSRMQIGGGPVFMDSWKKRFDSRHVHLASFGRGARKINTSSGQYRSYNMPVQAHSTREAWWAFIGDGPKVLELLEKTTVAIGKKSSEGFGWVERFELEREDWTATQVLRMRPVPLDRAQLLGLRNLDKTGMMSWKPPYWAPENVVLCRIPETA